MRPLDHHMTTSAHNRYIGAHDWFGISCHGLANTHLDALSHSAFEGKVYNGRNWTDAWTFEDVAAARGVEFLETGDCGCRTPPPRCRCT